MDTSVNISSTTTGFSASTIRPIALTPAGAAFLICPKGWTLPAKTQIDSLSGGSSSTAYVNSFSPVLGGDYINGTLNSESTV
ncbi:hypothetical protein IKF84_00730, partial [Candidatus Saccharibacteria bacterium]|nr:hypothetical protein [Candidatus Saccharibacteria bacterium]